MTYTHPSADQPSTGARTRSGGSVPLRGAPLQSVAPTPTGESVARAVESATALRASLSVPGPQPAARRLVSAIVSAARRLVGAGRA